MICPGCHGAGLVEHEVGLAGAAHRMLLPCNECGALGSASCCDTAVAVASPLPPQEMRAHLDTLKQLTEAEGRDFSALTISCKAPLYDTGMPSPDGSRRPFSGAPEDIAGDIRSFAAIGVHELTFDCRGRSIAESIERLQWFATQVIPLVPG
jgi:hypothetical protein